MEVWIVEAADTPCGYHVMGVFASRELAINYMKQKGHLLIDDDDPVYRGKGLDYFVGCHAVQEGMG